MVELVLVLAIVVVVAGLAVTHFTRSYSGQYLSKGADRVRAELGRARVQAMRTGEIHAFFYRPGTNQFTVARYADYNEIELADDSINRGQYQFFDQLLPADVYFSEADVEFDSRAQLAQESTQATSGNNDIRPVLFYGDGTSQNAKLTLSHTSGASIQVNLRGLTGLASSSKSFSRNQ